MDKVNARALARARARGHTCVQKVPSVRFCQSWRVASIAVSATRRYRDIQRRGGNRPITRRLLICRAQTAAVLPPMRNPRVYTARVYMYICSLEFPIEDSIPPGLTLGYSIGRGLLLVLLFGSRRSSSPSSCDLLSICPLPLALSTRCSDKTFLNWVSSEGDVCPALLEAQPASLRLFIDFCF